jgi:hypothetical protein
MRSNRRFVPAVGDLPARIAPATLFAPAIVATDPPDEDPPPKPEPDPGPLPTDEPPIIIPPLPPSGPVGPGK